MTKIRAMIAKEKLHFSRPDVFRDPFEGALSKNHTFPGNITIGNSTLEISIEKATEFLRR